jgi:S-adenosyl methyltransferase
VAGSRGNRGFDPRVAHPARVYDYWLGGKDNISQVVPAIPYSGHTQAIQERQAYYSKISVFAVRNLSGPSLSGNVRFASRGFLTLA